MQTKRLIKFKAMILESTIIGERECVSMDGNQISGGKHHFQGSEGITPIKAQ